MGLKSSIEWTEATWNPVTGCTRISPGCAHCYAERMSKRLKLMGQRNYSNGFKLTLHEDSLTLPLTWNKSQSIFVNSMSDLFHEDVPDDFILKAFDVMKKANWHRFQILTKRAERLEEINKKIDWPSNVWMGVSVENADYTYRIDNLRKTDAKIKFISFEPLLGLINNVSLKGIDWAIVGGESGPYARPMDVSWVLGIRDQCTKENVAFFFKQWGGVNKKKTGRILEGRTWDEMPIAIS